MSADIAENPNYASNADRVVHQRFLDDVLKKWCKKKTIKNAMSILEESRVPCGPVYNVADMMSDPHFNDRELFEKVEINGHLSRLFRRVHGH